MGTTYNNSISTTGLAFQIDAANPKSYSTNVYPAPIDIAAYMGFAATAAVTSRDTTTSLSPAGGIPFKMAVTGNDPYTNSYIGTQWSFATAASGQTWTVSVWIKSSAPTTGGFFIFGADATGMYIELSNPMWNITSEWQRFSSSFTFTNPNTVGIQVRFDGPDSGGAGVNLWFDGLQVEKSNSVSAFNPISNTNGANWYNLVNSSKNSTLVNGPTYSADNYGSLVFDGVNEYGGVSDTTGFGTVSLAPACTMSFWIKLTRKTGGGPQYQQVIGFRNETNYDFYFLLLDSSGATVSTEARLRTASGLWDINIPFVNYFGVWTNVTFVASSTRTDLYINGTLAGSATGVTGSFGASSGNFIIGSTPTGLYFTNGNISTVQFYNRSLSVDEVTQNYNAYKWRYGL